MIDLPPNDHNMGEEDPQTRADILKEAMREIIAGEADIAALRESISEIKHEKIKGKLGMKLSDFNVLKRAYLMEDKDKKVFLDTLREGFAALEIGEQASFLDALEPEPPVTMAG